jgi:hypothetical protein
MPYQKWRIFHARIVSKDLKIARDRLNHNWLSDFVKATG